MVTCSTNPQLLPATRIAFAGYGARGKLHARAITAIDGAEVVAALARNDTTRLALAVFTLGHSILPARAARLSVAVSLAAERAWAEHRPVRLDEASGPG